MVVSEVCFLPLLPRSSRQTLVVPGKDASCPLRHIDVQHSQLARWT